MKTVIALPLRIGTVYDLLEVEGIYDLETYDIVEADYDFIHEAMKNFKIAQYMINKLINPEDSGTVTIDPSVPFTFTWHNS